MENLKSKREKDLDPHEKAQKKQNAKNLTGNEVTFYVSISIWSADEHAPSTVRSVANTLETAMNYSGAVRFVRHNIRALIQDVHPIPWPVPWFRMTWTDKELANLFHQSEGSERSREKQLTKKEDFSAFQGFVFQLCG